MKALVVAEDETEGDYRAMLNFGHTLGHAIESLTEYKQLLHGEAVAIGMVAAARLSCRLGLCHEDDYQRIRRCCIAAACPTEIPRRPARRAARARDADRQEGAGRHDQVRLPRGHR